MCIYVTFCTCNYNDYVYNKFIVDINISQANGSTIRKMRLLTKRSLIQLRNLYRAGRSGSKVQNITIA